MRPSRALLAAFFTIAGALHFARPKPYEAIVPPSLQGRRKEIVAISGAAELAGAALVLPPSTRRLSRWWLISLGPSPCPAPADALGLARHPLSGSFPQFLRCKCFG